MLRIVDVVGQEIEFIYEGGRVPTREWSFIGNCRHEPVINRRVIRLRVWPLVPRYIHDVLRVIQTYRAAERSVQLLLDMDEARDGLCQRIEEAAAELGVDPSDALGVAKALASRQHGVKVVLALLGESMLLNEVEARTDIACVVVFSSNDLDLGQGDRLRAMDRILGRTRIFSVVAEAELPRITGSSARVPPTDQQAA